MGKIGYLLLNGGRWQGKQIVSETWLRESTKQQAPDRTYGYQWWLGQLPVGDRRVVTYGAQGRGGQFILAMPDAKRRRDISLLDTPFRVLTDSGGNRKQESTLTGGRIER